MNRESVKWKSIPGGKNVQWGLKGAEGAWLCQEQTVGQRRVSRCQGRERKITRDKVRERAEPSVICEPLWHLHFYCE